MCYNSFNHTFMCPYCIMGLLTAAIQLLTSKTQLRKTHYTHHSCQGL